ncbi:linear amide C-N hydrolase [Photobacterium sanguinicancri]|uniref:linear amide C-N hydrolase n=1 Tax=Photobacterium sanguinicancri TaxID=875932 RepID=UPI00078982BF|nr:linear amide C-N hydrolase [Photobacterium sanguinicancri]KXI24541.1 hydrolase [Photobacterium sanguinicancri]
MKASKTIIATLIAASTLSMASIATACTSAIYNNGDVSMTVRTMDWAGQDQAEVVGKGRGIENQYADTEDGITSKSKYASMQIKSFNPGIVAEAMNEKGLVARILYLGKDYTEFPEGKTGVPDVSAGEVPRFVVDNFATTDEALAALRSIDVIDQKICDLPGHANECISAPVHYQITDASGKSAVIEYVKGEQKIYEGTHETAPGVQFMSNDPEFSTHLIMDKEGTKADASIRSYDRRLRAKEIVEDLYARDVKDPAKAALSIKAVANNVFSGYDRIDAHVNDVFPTLWTIYTDQANQSWTLDRADTWEIEQYNFTMFDNAQAAETVLGQNPNVK